MAQKVLISVSSRGRSIDGVPLERQGHSREDLQMDAVFYPLTTCGSLGGENNLILRTTFSMNNEPLEQALKFI